MLDRAPAYPFSVRLVALGMCMFAAMIGPFERRCGYRASIGWDGALADDVECIPVCIA